MTPINFRNAEETEEVPKSIIFVPGSMDCLLIDCIFIDAFIWLHNHVAYFRLKAGLENGLSGYILETSCRAY